MSHAYNLGVQHALMKLGAEELAPPESGAPPEQGFWDKVMLRPELRSTLSDHILTPMPGELKSLGAGALGGAALGGIAGLASGKPRGAAMGATLGGLGGAWLGGTSKGISNIGTNYTHGNTVRELDKRLKAGPDEEERGKIMNEFDEAKALRKQKMDRLFW